MTKSEKLKNKMICGDWIVVANMLSITATNARKVFTRPGSKRYGDVVEAIEKVVKNREELLTNNK